MRPRFLLLLLLLCSAANCFAILDWRPVSNTADPGGGVPWASVGLVGGGSGIYLGNGWAMTAYHVGVGTLYLDSGTYQPDGRVVRLTNPVGGSATDIYLYHLTTVPNLPSLPISATTPATGSAVDLVGYGRLRGSEGHSFSTPYGPKYGFDWTPYRAKSHGTNKVAAGGVQTENFGVGPIQVFTLNFLPNADNASQLTTGDSGGAVFYQNGGTWELAGMMDARGSFVHPTEASVFGDVSYIADLATYKSQIDTNVMSVWNGTSDTAWATANNWSSALLPGAGYTVNFNNGGNGRTNVSLGAGVTVKTLLFNTASTAAYTIGTGAAGSQTLTLNNGGAIKTASSVTNSQLFTAALTLGEDATAQTYTISNNIAASPVPSLTLAGGIAGATGGTAGAKTLAVDGPGHTAITGGISTGGAVALTVSKTGTGTLDLSGAQSYAALTTSGGQTNVNGAFGSISSSVNVTGSGTTLKFGSVSQALGSLSISAGSTVTFTSGLASLADADDWKVPGFAGAPPPAGLVPEPGTTGLLLLGALGILAARRKRSS